MNILFLMTDTQNRDMVGAYGNPSVGTPHLDRLAAEGQLFDRAYTCCPLCTPARGALFSGIHPPLNGAWANSMAPAENFPLMGEIFSRQGYRVAYSGKWHLDGTSYFGDGQAGGGFPQEWWYDGKNYADDLGPERFEQYRSCRSLDDMRRGAFQEEEIWAHRVADRALDFLSHQDGQTPFLLVASFDEPHAPCVVPGNWLETWDAELIPERPGFALPLEGKPELQQQARVWNQREDWEQARQQQLKHYLCNRYVDSQIGRILDAVRERFDDNTLIVYTSDHGDMMGAHGLVSKGPFMYEETNNIPFILRLPGQQARRLSALASHIDLLPTLLDAAQLPIPEILQGTSLLPLLRQEVETVQNDVHMSFSRFGMSHDGWGGLFPIRSVVTERYKLNLNLFDRDELYDLQADPREATNRIEEEDLADVRADLHRRILDHMDRIRDPFRGVHWQNRPWTSSDHPRHYNGGTRHYRPEVFPFQSACLDYDGTMSWPVNADQEQSG